MTAARRGIDATKSKGPIPSSMLAMQATGLHYSCLSIPLVNVLTSTSFHLQGLRSKLSLSYLLYHKEVLTFGHHDLAWFFFF